jgi:hypothetical protein
MSDDPAPAPEVATSAEQAATSAPVGVSTRQIFTIALIILGIYAAYGAFLLYSGGDNSERAAFGQSAINLAMLAAGFYLGSSASSRNKDHRP